MTKVGFRMLESSSKLVLVLVAGGFCWSYGCSATTEQIGQTGSAQTPLQESVESDTSDVRVRIRSDPKAVFPKSGSFSFRQTQFFPNDPRVDVRALDTRMRKAIRSTMRGKGYEYKDLTSDLVIGFHIALHGSSGTKGRREEIDGPDWRGELNDVNTFEEGSIVLDILEWRSNVLLWRGVYEAKVLVEVSETEKNRRINDAVRRLLAHFPPKPATINP